MAVYPLMYPTSDHIELIDYMICSRALSLSKQEGRLSLASDTKNRARINFPCRVSKFGLCYGLLWLSLPWQCYTSMPSFDYNRMKKICTDCQCTDSTGTDSTQIYPRPVSSHKTSGFFSATKNKEYRMSPLAKVLSFTLLFSSSCVGVSLSTSNTGPVVKLSYGSFQGNSTGDIVDFLGMPFAAPPYASTQILLVVMLLILDILLP